VRLGVATAHTDESLATGSLESAEAQNVLWPCTGRVYSPSSALTLRM
jgi:hypothetical protein